MIALAYPALEAVAMRLLVALGLTAAGAATVDTVRKRKEEADNARTAPIATTEAQTKAKEKCKECPPDKGAPALQPTAGWGPEAIAYQQRIAQMPSAPPGYLTEWNFKGVNFDGFLSPECLLKEAKSTYDQFFDEDGDFKYPFQEKIFVKMTADAVRQYAAAQPMPPTRLRWYFMEPMSFRYMQRALRIATPRIEVVHQP
ncbi:Tox-REase-5 domain-containing protein [Ralstonia wenshanensis]|uniref:Tox-REase-5 domain-containing protein n=1 Tax=Ralstonia wenshanensis TaxID=2842456 RepID=UPI0039C6EC14